MLHAIFKNGKYFFILATMTSLLLAVACASAPTNTTTSPITTTPPSTTPTTTTPPAAPTLTIVSPADGGTLHQIGDVMVTVQVTNFNIVDKQGQANVPGEGHLHYYLDVPAPTTPDKPAIPPSGTWAHVASTTYTFKNVTGGQHTISVELINNDHTPLVPPVVATSTITVIPEIGPPSMVIVSPRDGDTLPAGDVTVSIQVSNFNIVDKQGQTNVSHEGHVHYYLDVEAPTTPGQPAIPPSGTWAHVASTTYTFKNVAPGNHTISVELINNDHTPLEPAVVTRISITVAAATSTPSPSPTANPSATPVTIDLIAKNLAFNMSTLTVPAGSSVTINFDNQDSGTLHNFSLYTNSSATPPALFQGQLITGPGTATYTFTAPTQPGTYFFRCDIHPTIMTGSFVVQ